MRRPKKLQYEVTCFDSWWWDFSAKRWIQIDPSDYEGNRVYRNVGSHVRARNMKQALRRARALMNLGAKDVAILRWSWPKGRRTLSEITLAS